MKKLIILFLVSSSLVSFVELKDDTPFERTETAIMKIVREGCYNPNIHGYYNYATPETFGYVVGGNVEDNNAALQASFDGTLNLTLLSQTYDTSVSLDIDVLFGQTITGSINTIIRATAVMDRIITVDFRGDANTAGTTMKDILIDGNFLGGWGLIAWSKVNLDNIDVLETRGDNAAGIYLRAYNEQASWGDWLIQNCDVTDIEGINNGIIGDEFGVTSSLLFYAIEYINPSNPTNVVFRNCVLKGSWSEDSQGIGVFSPGFNMDGSGLLVTFENIPITNSQRRGIKAFMGNTVFDNVTVTAFDVNHPRYDSNSPIIALMVVSPKSGTTGIGNITVKNSTFIGDNIEHATDGAELDELIYDGFTNTNNGSFYVQNNTFTNGADLDFGGNLNLIEICGNEFQANSNIGFYFTQGTQSEPIKIGTSNTFVDATPFATIKYSYVEVALNCPLAGGSSTALEIARKQHSQLLAN